jgi:hypothetical protein
VSLSLISRIKMSMRGPRSRGSSLGVSEVRTHTHTHTHSHTHTHTHIHTHTHVHT